MADPLEAAKLREQELTLELKQIQQFIEMYHRFSGECQAAGVDSARRASIANSEENLTSQVVDNVRRRWVRHEGAAGRSLQVADMVERILRENGQPMTRGELVAALELRDVALDVEDKARYVGTIVWRHKAKFRNIQGRGYWLAGEPLRPPHHEIGAEELDELLRERPIKPTTKSVFDEDRERPVAEKRADDARHERMLNEITEEQEDRD